MAIAALLLLLACLSSAAEVQVDATCPWLDREGYTPVLITARADHDTRVEIEARLDGNDARTLIDVPAGAVVRRTLLLPGSNNRWSSGVEVRWRAPGRGEERASLASPAFRAIDVVVVDPDESLALRELREEMVRHSGNPPQDPNGAYSASTATTYDETRFARWSADTLPDRWQGWPAWLTVLTTPEGDRRLSEAQRQSLAAWTLAGGRLFVAEARQLAAWRAIGAQVAVAQALDIANGVKSCWTSAGRRIQTTPVPGTGQIPVNGFVTIAVLFALIVGPLNFWWCSRRGSRHLLLLTTPVLSCAASVLLLAYGLAADGLGLRRTVVQLLAFDEQSGRVAGWTSMGVFAGLAPGRIELDADDLIAVVQPESDEWREGAPTTLLWDDAQHALGSWIPSRTQRHLMVATVRPERRRLVFARTGDGWTVANGFDRPLVALSWHDPQEQDWYVGAPVAAGAVASLAPGIDPARVDERSINAPWAALPTAAANATRRGAWVARFDGALLPIPGPEAIDVGPVSTWVTAISAHPLGEER